MLASANPNIADEARRLWQEAKELNLIFATIFRNSESVAREVLFVNCEDRWVSGRPEPRRQDAKRFGLWAWFGIRSSSFGILA
jgi:hypothetical protein